MKWRRIAGAAIGLLLLQVAAGQEKNLTIDEIFASSDLRPAVVRLPQWLEGGKKLSCLETNPSTHRREIYLYSVSGRRRELALDVAKLVAHEGEEPMEVASYEWSRDGRRVLLTGTLPARRTKSGGNFGVYDIPSGTFRLLTDTSAEQAIIKLSPDGQSIGFVRSNNLFMTDVAGKGLKQLTFDGSADVINGKFDWVYEEEFSIIDGWQWSPDSRRIAFWRLDQSKEPEFPLIRYAAGEPGASVRWTRYPQAGEPNALVRIGIVDCTTGKTSWVDLGSNPDIYIPRICWTSDPDILCVEKLNRAQDTLDVMLADARTGAARTILTETDTAWVDVRDDLTFLRRTDQFLWTSNRDGFTHIYLYNMDGSLVRQVTRGAWEVIRIAGVDEQRRRIYFLATAASPLEQQLYSIGYDGEGMRRITKEHGVHAVNISPDERSFLDTYSHAGAPPRVSVRSIDDAPLFPVLENRLDQLRDYRMGGMEFFTFTTPDTVLLHGWMIKPPDFRSDRKYPLLMFVYGGPGSQTVRDEWGGTDYLWHQMLAEEGYIVASVDNRGTGGRGKSFLQQTHKRLGLLEVQDQISGSKYLGGLPFVDSSRIGIWGWSGGGFMTCLAMTLGAGSFKTGIAVAPVTSWRFYDSIYTERYMDTPQHNPEGYLLTSPITYADRLAGKLLIVHGTTDDNVHWQNSIVFIDALIHRNKQITTMFYPDKDHGIRGDNARRHLFTLMTEYLRANL